MEFVQPKRCAVKKDGAKVAKKAKAVPLEQILAMSCNRAPNMSRKVPGLVLYSFPSFDKCDSLLFFPSTLTACINSGDQQSLKSLLKSRINSQCVITGRGRSLDFDTFLYVFSLLDQLHPDSVMCVYSTKVVQNEIRTCIHFKCTETKSIRDAVKRTVSDPTLLDLSPAPYDDLEGLSALLASKPEDEREEQLLLAHTAESVLIYGQSRMVLTFDDFTKKITRLDMNCWYTSFAAVC